MPPHNFVIIPPQTLDPSRALSSVTAQCADSADNDLDGRPDGFDESCPSAARTGGLVPCGRYADDLTTPINESAPCSFCHFFYLFRTIINAFVVRFAPIVGVLMLVFGGFTLATSAGNVERLTRGKSIIVWALSGYVILLIGWIFVNMAFTKLGLETWTGLKAERGVITATPSNITICDQSKSWRGDGAGGERDQWQGVAVSTGGQVRIIETNTLNCLTVRNPFDPAVQVNAEFKIGGWWQFVCK